MEDEAEDEVEGRGGPGRGMAELKGGGEGAGSPAGKAGEGPAGKAGAGEGPAGGAGGAGGGEPAADRAAFAVVMLVEGHPQAFVDFFYLTHAGLLPDAAEGGGAGGAGAGGAAAAGGAADLAGAEP